jgi:hypothetical protein
LMNRIIRQPRITPATISSTKMTSQRIPHPT